jgi:hypothetical protein
MSTTPLYSQEVINIGANPNDGNGDPLRIAFSKINNNFANLFQTFLNSTVAYSFGNTAGQVIFEAPANTFTQGQFFIKSIDGGTANSQSVQLFAQLSNDQASVKFTGYGSTFFGTPVSRYDMSVNNTTGNVQILVNPLTSDDLTHYIASQIMWAGPNVSGIAIGLDGYSNSAMSTETSVPITTEQSTV